MPAISICIPAYKGLNFLTRLLDSIKDQTFKDFEVIVTDDSPDDEVRRLCLNYQSQFALLYHKNLSPLGTPENWNEGIRRASGTWIKLMHDDDWFTTPGSLATFAQAANDNTDFVYSAFINVWLESNDQEIVRPGKLRGYALQRNPVSILSKNIIGPPSVTMCRNHKGIYYDGSMKWLVDMDFYIRYLPGSNAKYIDEPLVSIGIHGTQVTVTSQLNPAVEIPEHLRLLEKTGINGFRNIFFYDAWWRLIRNLKIRSAEELTRYAPNTTIPPVIVSIIRFQQHIGAVTLRMGLLSKFFMTLSFVQNYFRGK